MKGTTELTGSEYWFMHVEAPALAKEMKREFDLTRESFKMSKELLNPEPIVSIYDYDPILGLRYYSEETRMLNLNMEALPDMKIKLSEVMNHLKRHKMMIIDSSKEMIDNCGRIISNF